MLKAYAETFNKYKYLLYNLISRDFRVKYRRSVLGILWSMLNPILMVLILNAVFSRVFRFEIDNFALYLISGQTLFTFFNEATSSSIFSIVEASSLIKKVYIPKYLFPMEKVLFAFVNCIFSMLAVVVMLLIYKVPFSWTMLLFFVPLVGELMFACGFSLIISCLCVFFRDLKHLYSVLLTAWMYMTPIIYPISIVEGSWIRYIVYLNPLTTYVETFRSVVMYGQTPSAEQLLVGFGYGIIFMALGLFIFRKGQDKFILNV
ncbi:MAG: ABC transporter permease [Oscillospiraceae bacterium]|nr:ABC transporter permease [Oscillospiraceae bacterium]